eukprot:jgi/Chlat1/5546/Chrsp369S05399
MHAAHAVRLLAAGVGRITGVSGIAHSALLRGQGAWRFAFLCGLVTSGLLMANLSRTMSSSAPHQHYSQDWSAALGVTAVAGALVGFGSAMGGGCTSGHGVCGLARLSKRSLAAVVTFMSVAVVTASLLPVEQAPLIPSAAQSLSHSHKGDTGPIMAAVLAVLLGIVSLYKSLVHKDGDIVESVCSYAAGSLFGVGLIKAQMTDPRKVMSFLRVRDGMSTWDPTLAFVMGGALLVTLVAFRMILTRKQPLMAAQFSLPTKSSFTRRLFLGSAVFGVGWGLGGVCPGPGLVGLGLTASKTACKLATRTPPPSLPGSAAFLALCKRCSRAAWVWVGGILAGMLLYDVGYEFLQWLWSD